MFHFFPFLDDHLKIHIFIGFVAFSILFFFCFSVSNIKKTKTKNAIFFSKTSFLTSPQFCENTILAQCDIYKYAKNHYKNGGNSKNLDQF